MRDTVRESALDSFIQRYGKSLTEGIIAPPVEVSMIVSDDISYYGWEVSWDGILSIAESKKPAVSEKESN